MLPDEGVATEEEQDEGGLYEHHRITVDKGQASLRLDKYLQMRLEGISRNKIQTAAKAGCILVNEKPAKSNYKVKPEDVEKEFPGFLADFRWQLVRGAFMKNYGFTVDQKDLEEAARAYVTYQYAMYGMGNVPEDIISNSAKQVLEDRSQIDRLVEQVEDRKVLAKLKEEVTLTSKRIGSEKFRELK